MFADVSTEAGRGGSENIWPLFCDWALASVFLIKNYVRIRITNEIFQLTGVSHQGLFKTFFPRSFIVFSVCMCLECHSALLSLKISQIYFF